VSIAMGLHCGRTPRELGYTIKDLFPTREQGVEVFARGRNGMFTPYMVTTINYPDRTAIMVESKRGGNSPPIMLSLARADAIELADNIKRGVSFENSNS